MNNRLLMTTAVVALLAGTSFATAQDKKEGAAPAPAAQQTAPAEKIAPPATAKVPEAKPQNVRPDVKAEGMKPEGKPAAQAPTSASDKKVEGKSEMKATETKREAKSPAAQNAETKSPEAAKPSTTTGQGAAGARANLTTEQRTTIKTVIREQKVAPVTNAHFSISVGTRIPHETRLYPLPARVIEVYPSWRGYEYILVGDEILVIDPGTFEIVAVLEV